MPAVWTDTETILATRAWIPLQDTPSLRTSYDAVVRVPAGELALMSASNNPTAANDSGVYTLSMPHTIPAYLIALTVARLDFRDLGNRTGVYAEPSLLDDTAYEMQFVPGMLSAAERVIAPYPFERYDLVFPPKYLGGMENPELNFLGQDLITGNRPPVVPPHIVVAHELAHAWFSGEVTLATWSDIWLNESFATYYEKRIQEEMAGWELAELGLYRDRQNLTDYLATKPAARLTVLHRKFQPGEGLSFTVVWYVKGEMLLETLEQTLGRPALDAFIRVYLQEYAYRWVDDVAFRTTLLATTAADPAMVDDWLYGTGLPASIRAPSSSAIWQRLNTQATRFLGGTKASALDTAGWTTVEVEVFLEQIPNAIPGRLDDLDAAFHFSQMNTPPPLWLGSLAQTLRPNDRATLDRYLSRGTPNSEYVWSRLAQSSAGRAYAVPLFMQVRDSYPPDAAATIAMLLQIVQPMAA